MKLLHFGRDLVKVWTVCCRLKIHSKWSLIYRLQSAGFRMGNYKILEISVIKFRTMVRALPTRSRTSNEYLNFERTSLDSQQMLIFNHQINVITSFNFDHFVEIQKE